jgi:hypothetical protein
MPPIAPRNLAALAATLIARRDDIASLRSVVGLDGFIDEMISVVGERRGLDDWTALPSMVDLGGIIARAAGHNSLREIVVRSQDPGGCAVNLGDALIQLGVGLDFLGTLGAPRHPAFEHFAAACRSCAGLGTAFGRTLAFEFADGKFMFSAVSQLGEIRPDVLAEALADGAFVERCRAAALIALTNWTLYPHMTACWRLLHDAVFKHLGHRPWLFIDLVDPSSRSEADIRALLATLTGFERDCKTVLGLNLNEAKVLGSLLGLGALGDEAAAVRARAVAIREALGISQVVIHHARLNAVAEQGSDLAVDAGPFCVAPRKTTGAGDRFNAGYGLGLMLGLPAEQRLALGAATSGVFVRQARSATLDEVVAFLGAWAAGRAP